MPSGVTTTWHRSLYWRIALGVVAFLAAMLVVQAMLFVWVVSQSGRIAAGAIAGPARDDGRARSRERARADPQTDLARYVREQYAQYTHPFFVMLADGRLITSGSQSFPEPLLRMARAAARSAPDGRFRPSRRPRCASGAPFERVRVADSTGRVGPTRGSRSAASASCARRRSSSTAGWPASSSCRRRRRSASCSAASRRCWRWSPPAC